MNWDTTKLKINTGFSSEPLTVIGIEGARRIQNQDYYSVKVGENIIYREGISIDLINNLINRSDLYIRQNDNSFYYLVNQLKKTIKIPFRRALFSENKLVFLLNEGEINDIIQEERQKWVETDYIQKEDLKVENKDIVDAKYETLYQNEKGERWTPQLSETERNLIKESKTVREVKQTQRQIALRREQKQDANLQGAITDLKDQLSEQKKVSDKQISDLKEQLKILQEKLEKSEKKNVDDQRKISEQKEAHDEQISKLNQKLESAQDLQSKNGDLKKELEIAKKSNEEKDTKEKELNSLIKDLRKENDKLKEDLAKASEADQAEKIKELEEKTKRLESSLANNRKITSSLQEENRRLKSEIAKLREEMEALQVKQQSKLEDIKSLTISEIENLMKGNDSQSAVSAEQLLKKLKGDGKLADTVNDWREYIQEAVNLEMVNDRQSEIKNAIESLRRVEVIDEIDKVKSTAISDINKALADNSLEEKDIISDYQGYAEKIRGFNSQQEVKHFTEATLDYLPKQKAAYEMLNNALKKAIEISDSGRDQEEGIFEQRRQTRQTLDNLAENSLRESKHAYQVINKNNQITDYAKNLAKWIWDYLNENKKNANDPANEKFLKMLTERGYVEGTNEFDYYWILQAIVKEFAKVRLEGKEVDFYPYVTIEKTDGHTNWRKDSNESADFSGFDFHVDLSRLINKGVPPLFDTLMHELMHDVIMLREYKKELPENQYHSKPFWEGLYYIGDNSALNYSISCLPFEDRQKMKVLTNVLEDTKFTDARTIYFPNTKIEGEKIRRRQFFGDEYVSEGWNSSREMMLRLTDESMNENLNNWEDDSEISARWFEISVLHSKRNLKNDPITEENRKKHKIYLVYNQETFPKLKEKIEERFGSWEERKWSRSAAEELFSQINTGSVACGCGKENEVKQEAKIVVQPPFNHDR